MTYNQVLLNLFLLAALIFASIGGHMFSRSVFDGVDLPSPGISVAHADTGILAAPSTNELR